MEARQLLPVDGEMALNRRQASELTEAQGALAGAKDADLVPHRRSASVGAVGIRSVEWAAGMEEMLDALFGRFCLGK
jgi:tRNA modification GTPase